MNSGGELKERIRLQIFLSYAHVESRFADLIQEVVTRDFIGLAHVWIASDGGIIAGEEWLRKVRSALTNSHLHVVLCSPDSITRQWISFETGAAYVQDTPIISLCHSGLLLKQLPVPLDQFQAIQLNERHSDAGVSGFERFYVAVADQLGSDVPRVNFDEYEDRLMQLEQTYAAERGQLAQGPVEGTAVEVIPNPKVLCISSRQFVEQGFGAQIDTVLNAFPKSVEHHRALDLRALKDVIASEKDQANLAYVVHIAAYVCPRSGDLYFSNVNFATGEPQSQPIDKITADALAQLLNRINTRLVVITGADSLALTMALQSVCHVVAAREMVSPRMIATWVAEFYEMLPNTSLSEALNFATSASRAPMRFHAKQTKSVDIRLALPRDVALT
jgi:hypothetical protein